MDYKLISAADASRISAEYIKRNEKICKIINYTNEIIQEACNSGKKSVKITRGQIAHLDAEQKAQYLSILHEHGYVIGTVYKEYGYTAHTTSLSEAISVGDNFSHYDICW